MKSFSKFYYLFFTIIFVTVMFTSISCDIDPEDPPELNNEEHMIISAVLDSIKRGQVSETVDVYDMTSTMTYCTSLHIEFQHDGVGSDQLLDHYQSANNVAYALDMDKLPDYVMLKDSEESDRYSGYFLFTRPGISDNGLLAVVEYSSVSAPLCGIGMAALLEKQDDEWSVVWLEMIWIS